jgi:hypothetical protein
MDEEFNLNENSIYYKHKMIFIMNALEDGWTIKKINNSYFFRKKHEDKKEVFLESYLENFIKNNIKEKGEIK